MKILIKNGQIVDGSGKAGYPGDVLIDGDRIAAVGRIAAPPDAEVCDVGGMVVAPGFIDSHSHSDLAALTGPQLSAKIRQGITTEVLGQDGISLAPLPVEYIGPWRKNLAGLDGVSDTIDWTYATTDRYLSLLEAARPACNLAYLAPHGNLRMEAMGLGNRHAGSEELRKMVQVLERELEAGAFGMSTGLIYMPCAYAATEELVTLCRAVAARDGIFVVHQRSEADAILESTEELLTIARRSGVWLHISHLKVCGRKNWPKLEPMLDMLEKAMAEGVRISFDQYPYVAGSTMLGVILPPWVHDGGTEKVIERLASPRLREKMIEDIRTGIPGWDNFIDFAGPDQIFVTSVKSARNQDAIGKSLVELGEMRGKDPLNAAFDLLQEEENAVGMVDFYGAEEHVVRIMNHPLQSVCSDGLMGPGKPHPRVYGAFPRVLGKYVREEKTLSLEAAIHKMTGRPAAVIGLPDRGLIAVGHAADVTVFDPAVVADKATYVDPVQFPVGIEHVMVNGQWAVVGGKETAARTGRVLRKGRN